MLEFIIVWLVLEVIKNKWIAEKTEKSIVPSGLRERDFKSFPAKERKTKGPLFGTNVGMYGYTEMGSFHMPLVTLLSIFDIGKLYTIFRNKHDTHKRCRVYETFSHHYFYKALWPISLAIKSILKTLYRGNLCQLYLSLSTLM